MADDSFKPVTRADVDDHGLMPQQLRNIARDVKALYSLIENSVIPGLGDIVKRLDHLDRADGAIELRLSKLEAEVLDLRTLIAVRR